MAFVISPYTLRKPTFLVPGTTSPREARPNLSTADVIRVLRAISTKSQAEVAALLKDGGYQISETLVYVIHELEAGWSPHLS